MQGGVELMELVMSHMGGIIYSFKKMGPRCEVRLMQLFMLILVALEMFSRYCMTYLHSVYRFFW